MTRPCALIALLAAAALAAAQPPASSEGRRIALVIGNDAYPAGALQNAVNDARAMQKSLAGAGFRVILAENAGKAAMEQQAAEFLQSIGPGDTALFFFAGHAVQIAEVLIRDHLNVVCTAGHPLAGRRSVSWGDLAGCRLITLKAGYGIRRSIDQAAAPAA